MIPMTIASDIGFANSPITGTTSRIPAKLVATVPVPNAPLMMPTSVMPI